MNPGCLARLPNPRVAVARSHELSRSPARFHVLPGNPLDDGWSGRCGFDAALAANDPRNPVTLLAWSGTLGPTLFEGEPRNWMRAGRDALAGLIATLLPRAHSHGVPFGFIPHHFHLLSDVAGQMRVWHEHADAGWATVLSPATLIATSMHKDLHDHLRRAVEMVAPRASLCLLEDLVFDAHADTAPRRVEWGSGEIPHESVVEWLESALPLSTPIAVGCDLSDGGLLRDEPRG